MIVGADYGYPLEVRSTSDFLPKHLQMTTASTSVLLIDADGDYRAMYTEVLGSRGLTVFGASTTDDGLLKAVTADLVVTAIRVSGTFDVSSWFDACAQAQVRDARGR
jgi:hypothetical protein